VSHLVSSLTGKLPPSERADAGRMLGQLGDQRPGVGVKGGLSDIAWCGVSAGKLIMGSEEGEQRALAKETPQNALELPAYWISTYPITNAQFDAFVQDRGYTDKWRACWTRAGWKWKSDRVAPGKQGGVFDLPNHPVVMVTWYETHAFCLWLGAQLGTTVSLPTEVQWERAARGTDGRRYPWGGELTPDHANYDQTGIDTTTAVGIFPKGANPETGVLDMSGNVWEWCRTKWRDSYKVKPDEWLEGTDARVLRGGAFFDSTRRVRCAFRFRDSPRYRIRHYGFRVVASPVIHDSGG
jgi:formylglycine-generating enzyme required for sulfatase activity